MSSVHLVCCRVNTFEVDCILHFFIYSAGVTLKFKVQPLNATCRPLYTLSELENWNSRGLESCQARFTLDRTVDVLNRPRLLLCHDMMGGYLDCDKYVLFPY